MGCTPPIKTTQTRKQLVFTTAAATGGDQTFVFTDTDIEQIATLLESLRVSVLVESRIDKLKVDVIYELSDDGEIWDTPQPVISDISANGTVTSSWLTSTNWKRAIRISVKAIPDAATTLPQGPNGQPCKDAFECDYVVGPNGGKVKVCLEKKRRCTFNWVTQGCVCDEGGASPAKCTNCSGCPECTDADDLQKL